MGARPGIVIGMGLAGTVDEPYDLAWFTVALVLLAAGVVLLRSGPRVPPAGEREDQRVQ